MKYELLAPAGNMECLIAAIEAGCDAVYIGGKRFGARSFADNFTKEEIVEAINYAHLYGVKIYVTLNIIVYENEVYDFINYVRFLHKNNVDAIIMQDLGMMDLVRKKFPNLEIHASTQMNIHTFEGAKILNDLGIKRVVLARETDFEVIKKIKKELDIEVETFIHGALCVSYSGQCLMSYLVGKRSGNRGTCAQICRKKYSLIDDKNNIIEKDKYLLSTKDLCTIENIDKLINIGINSFKIEGRMKRKEYVYLVVSTYKKVIDNYLKTGKLKVDESLIEDLKLIFNRDFTKGFMFNEDNKNIVNIDTSNHKGVEIGKVIKYEKGFITIKLEKPVSINDGLRIISNNKEYGLILNNFYIDRNLVKEARKGDIISFKYTGRASVGDKIVKTTDYKQISEIERNIKNKKRKVNISFDVIAKKNKPLILKVFDGKNSILASSSNILEESINKALTKELIETKLNRLGDTVYNLESINIDLEDNLFIDIKSINDLRRDAIEKLNQKRLYQIEFKERNYNIDVPDFINERVIYKENECLKTQRIIREYKTINKDIIVSELGSFLKYDNIITDSNFNVTNSYTVAFLHSIGAKRITLSYELNFKQIKNIIDKYKERHNKHPNLEVIVNSKPVAMVTRYNLLKKYDIEKGYLVDEFKNKYELISEDTCMKVINYEKQEELDKEELFNIGINFIRTI